MADKVEFKGSTNTHWANYSWNMERQHARDRNTIVHLQDEVSRLKPFENKHIDINSTLQQFMQLTTASLDTYLGNLQTTKEQKQMLSELTDKQAQTIIDQHILLMQYKQEVELYKNLLDQSKEELATATKEQATLKQQLTDKDAIIDKYSKYVAEKRDLMEFYDEE
jgi:hypothetical protein